MCKSNLHKSGKSSFLFIAITLRNFMLFEISFRHYVDMIKALIESRKLEPPEISEDFFEAEILSINSMVTFINKEISTTDESIS